MKYAVYSEYLDRYEETLADSQDECVALAMRLLTHAQKSSTLSHPLPQIPFGSWEEMKEYGLRVGRFNPATPTDVEWVLCPPKETHTGKEQVEEKQPTCETCRFFDSKAEECRINPPTFSGNTGGFLIGGTGLMFGGHVQGWPDVDKDKWCGKHTPNAELSGQ